MVYIQTSDPYSDCHRATDQMNPIVSSKNSKKFCKYCWDRGHSTEICFSHYVKDKKGRDGVIVCPFLLKEQCMRCGERGHTPRYCASATPLLTVDNPTGDANRCGDMFRLIHHNRWIEPIPEHLRADYISSEIHRKNVLWLAEVEKVHVLDTIISQICDKFMIGGFILYIDQFGSVPQGMTTEMYFISAFPLAPISSADCWREGLFTYAKVLGIFNIVNPVTLQQSFTTTTTTTNISGGEIKRHENDTVV